MAKTLTRQFKGLTFNYRMNAKTPLLYKTLEPDVFVNESFPKKDNPKSPREHTTIFNVRWNRQKTKFADNSITVSDLKELVKSVKNEDGTYNMNQFMRKYGENKQE